MTTTFAVFAPHFPPASAGGGPARSLDGLTTTAPADVDVLVLTSDRDEGAPERLPVPRGRWTGHGRVPVLYADLGNPLGVLRALASVRRRHPTHLYLNSFFHLRLSLVPRLLARAGWWRGATVVVAPRGEFGSWALGSKGRKKRAFLRLHRLLGLHRGVLWHAATETEAADIREVWGDSAQVVVDLPRSPLPRLARRGGPPPSDAVQAVSLGRLTRLKGLDVVLRGLQSLPDGSRIHLDSYGPPEEPDLVAECEEIARHLPEGVSWSYRGPLDHEHVQDTLSRYDVALLGTHGETFGHAVAEVLSVGCPLLVADTTPWTPVVAGGAGLVVPAVTPRAWTETISRFLSLDTADKARMRDAAALAFEEAQASRGRHLFELVLDADDAPR